MDDLDPPRLELVRGDSAGLGRVSSERGPRQKLALEHVIEREQPGLAVGAHLGAYDVEDLLLRDDQQEI
jgi:hypothetical protein